jgi:hypothetical protein
MAENRNWPTTFDGSLLYRISTIAQLWIALWDAWKSPFIALRKSGFLWLDVAENWNSSTRFFVRFPN